MKILKKSCRKCFNEAGFRQILSGEGPFPYFSMNLKRLNLTTSAILAAGALFTAIPSEAATVTWSGNTSNDFNTTGTNWATGSVPSLSADTWQVNAPGPQGNSTLVVNGPLTFTGTSGKIAFGGSSNFTLTGGDISLAAGTGDGILAGSANQTITVNNNLIFGNGNSSTTSVTSNVQGANFVINGNITGGSGGVAGTTVISLGSTGTKNGNYTISGSISAGPTATGLTFTKRGNGTATLTGANNVINTLNSNEGGKVVIAGGNTTIATAIGFTTTAAGAGVGLQVTSGTVNLTMTNSVNGWGTGANANNTIQISGGVVNTGAGRAIRSNLTIDGGALNFNTGADRFSMTTANATLNISSGSITYNPTTGFGVRLGGDSGPTSAGGIGFTGVQTGGNFTVNGVGAAAQTFSLGSNTTTAGVNATYTLSGGTLNIKGSNSTNGRIDLGADAGGVNTTTFALTGSGKLVIEGNSTNAGIFGSQASAKQVLSLTGGTLVVGNITATNLRGSEAGTNGTIVNNGTKIAPGDTTNAGRTSITGSLSIASGTFDVNLGGTTAAVAWQEASNATRYDNIAVTGTTTLGGLLNVSFINGFASSILVGNSFTILSSTGSLSGTFSNAATSYVVENVNGNNYDFLVSYAGNNVTLTLSSITAIPEPSTYALGIVGLLGLTLMARRRRRRVNA